MDREELFDPHDLEVFLLLAFLGAPIPDPDPDPPPVPVPTPPPPPVLQLLCDSALPAAWR